MLLVLTAIAIFQSALADYSVARILPVPDTSNVGRIFLTSTGLVAGHWYRFVGPGHAGDVLAKPFVWTSGKTIPLPLGTAKYGHVFAASDERISAASRSTAATSQPNGRSAHRVGQMQS